MIRRWNAFWFTPGQASTLGACRLWFFGLLFLWMLPHDFRPWGQYSSVFWMPIWLFDRTGIPAFSPETIGWIQLVWKLSLLLAAVGLYTRAAMIVALPLGTYLMGLPQNFGQTQHFDTLVVFAMTALAVSRAGDAVSLDSLIRAVRARSAASPPPSGEYTWPLRFVWVAMALAFGAAGFAKLRHSGLEWIFSDNFALLLLRQQYHLSDGEPLTRWGIAVAHHPWLAQTMAAAAVSIETLFPLALFSRRARMILVPASLGFLVGIRALMGPTFEQFIMCFVFWVPWEQVSALVRSRIGVDVESERIVLYDGDCGLCSRSAIVLSRLDLLRRVSFADMTANWDAIAAEYPSLDQAACDAEMHVLTGDGRVYAGFNAWRALAWVIPAGWFLLPFLYLPGIPQLGRHLYRSVAARRQCAVGGGESAVELSGR